MTPISVSGYFYLCRWSCGGGATDGMQIIHVNVYRVAPPSGGGGYYKSHHLQHNIPVTTFSSAMKCLRTEGMFLLHARNLGYFFVETEPFVTDTPPK